MDNNDIVSLVRRGSFFDVFINKAKYGSGIWEAVYTARWFYRAEGMEVKIYE
jgi:hypothetical protein